MVWGDKRWLQGHLGEGNSSIKGIGRLKKTGYAVDTQAGAMIKSQLGACTLCPHPRLLKSDETRDTI